MMTVQPAAQRAQPIKPGEVPAKKRVAPLPPRGTFVPPRTPWGDPDIAGDYNNSDESGIPFEKPDEFKGRRAEDITPAEFARLVQQRQEAQELQRIAQPVFAAHQHRPAVEGCAVPAQVVRLGLEAGPRLRSAAWQLQRVGRLPGRFPVTGAHGRQPARPGRNAAPAA